MLALAALAAFGSGVPAAAQNLIVNPGFEPLACVDATTICPGWTFTGLSSSVVTAPHTGIQAGQVDGFGLASGGFISQSVTLPQSGRYAFSFWYTTAALAPGSNVQFTASVGGKTVFDQLSATTPYTQVSTQIQLSRGAANVLFAGNSSALFQAGLVIDDVSLTLLQAMGLTSNLPIAAPQNAVNVTQAIDAFINAGGTLPGGFNSLFNLTPADLQAAALQLSGEAATGAQQSSYQLMNDFLLLMMEPGTLPSGAGGYTATPFASAQAQSLPPDVAMAYASVLKAPPAPTVAGWNVWGSAYGGAGHLDGDAAVVGSHDLTTNAGGVAAGADRLVTPNTRVGFALAGGFTGWGLADGFGGGRGDAFQAGAYGRTTLGPAYLAGAFAFTEHWMSTDRFVLGDHLTADFNAQSVGGRLEGGYRLPASYTPYIGVIPYAAIQAQRFHTPGFSETDVTGGGLGLTFNAQSSTDTRAELGSRFDKLTRLDDNAIIAWRARLAWAHDWVTNPALTATFQALPGASFVVNGAAPRHDSALVTFGPEVTWRNGWSMMAKFDGEFASGEQVYAGTARLRYAW